MLEPLKSFHPDAPHVQLATPFGSLPTHLVEDSQEARRVTLCPLIILHELYKPLHDIRTVPGGELHDPPTLLQELSQLSVPVVVCSQAGSGAEHEPFGMH